MYDQISLEATGSATVRLLDAGWASYFRRALTQLKQVGCTANRTNGANILIERLRRTRPGTYEHAVRVARLAHATGRVYGFDSVRLKQLGQAAMLHDIGKIFVPESFLNRPRRLTRSEAFIMRLHPTLGALLLSYFNLSKELSIRTQHHHERWDGSGYPNRLGGEEIPLMARIVQVADTYDAMVVDRPYRKGSTHEEAIAEIRRHCNKQFDARIVEAFLDSPQFQRNHTGH
jgi:putative nucleotidyltransferase with HDIG domain